MTSKAFPLTVRFCEDVPCFWNSTLAAPLGKVKLSNFPLDFYMLYYGNRSL